MAFLVDKSEHPVGDRRCCECWAGYPIPCRCKKGFVHAQFLRRNSDGGPVLATICDHCGEDFKKYLKHKNK